MRLDASALDYGILAIYFAVVLGIGLVARDARPGLRPDPPRARDLTRAT